ncbi:MAG TPA: T9SS type A sorting domain-containing protein [Flavobacteriales bacterium]|nr:T9SS type A sorting domain-containing protein [Flavobacteriales bacterium]
MMKRPYPLLFIFLAWAPCSMAQTVITPGSVSSTLPSFYGYSIITVDNLIADISPATGPGTTFPYAPNDQFSQGIGYVSQFGQWQGSITYTFQNATSVSQMWLWNAYFDFELDHSLKNALLTFQDEAGQVISTANVSFPKAVASVLTPDVVDLPTEVLGVKKVVVTVQSLWGGNEISLRRMAFAGTNQQTGISDLGQDLGAIRAYPNPGHGATTINAAGVVAVEVFDAAGRTAQVDHLIGQEEVVLSWAGHAAGMYQVLLHTRDGRRSVRVVVE